MEETDKPLTRFDQIKSCETPEDMVVILNGNELRFCPKGYKAKPVHCEEPCGRCISNWLKEPTRPRFSPEEVAIGKNLLYVVGSGTIFRSGTGGTFLIADGKTVSLRNDVFPSIRPGQSIALEDIIEGAP